MANLKQGIEDAHIAEIRGGMYDVTITYDNGYSVKASGELYPGATFYAYRKSLKHWCSPHENEPFTLKDARKVVDDVNKSNGPNKVKVVFQGDFAPELVEN